MTFRKVRPVVAGALTARPRAARRSPLAAADAVVEFVWTDTTGGAFPAGRS